ncbi:DNA polymerase phi-domain-containing protein [Dichotomocladium elegans]|nr:DNA polymerase phi-domain-containing protein [Dichotomocladium elegans]
MATTTLQLYWDLGSIDPSVRQNATQALIRLLVNFQKDHEATLEADEVAPANTEEQLDSLCATDVAYAIRRLLRGLPSSRQGARQGFSLALTELLSVTNVITVKLVLDFLFKYTERTNKMTGEESRDMLFGRLFGLMSIITAGMLSKPTTTLEDVERILDSLKDIADAKSFLVEVCYHVVINMLPTLRTEYKDQVITKIIATFLGEVENVNQLSLALAFQQKLPEVDLTASFQSWKSTNVLAPVNLAHLASILRESSEDEQETQADWKPQLHNVWDMLLDIYLQPTPEAGAPEANGHAEQKDSDRPKKKQRISKNGDSKYKTDNTDDQTRASFEAFWSAAVDRSLFDNSSHGRKYWGFLLVQKVLPRLSSEQIPLIFTENFMRVFMNNLSYESRYLNKAAMYTAKAIQKVAQDNKQVSFALVTQLVGKNGNQNFDRITKTKTVENILATMDNEGIKSYLEYLARIFIQQQGDDTNVDALRTWVLSQMSLLVKNNRIPKDEVWLGDVARFLMVYAFFDVEKGSSKSSYLERYHKPTPELSDDIRNSCKNTFQTVLVALSNMPVLAKNDQNANPIKSRKFHGVRNDGDLWVYYVLQIFQKLQKDKHLSIHQELSAESKQEYKKALGLVQKLHEKTPEPESLERGFEILYIHMILHLLIDEDEAQELLVELSDCFDKILPKKKSNGKKKKALGENNDDELGPEPIDVLVDILISFLTNASPVLRDLAERVFEIFSHKITKQTLAHLLDILSSSDKNNGSEELFDNNDEDGEDSDVQEIEIDSDVEMIDDDMNDEGEVDEELRHKLEEVMKKEGVLAGSDDEEEDLDDDAMAEFDDKLAEVFRQKKLEKKAKKDVQLSVIHFKIYVMDLIIIFVRKNPSNPMVLDIIVPLLNILRATPAKSVTSQFAQKIMAFLKNKLPKIPEYPKEHDGHIVDIFKAVYDFAKATNSKEISDMCIQLALYLRKCVLGGSDVELDESLPAKAKKEIEKLNAIESEAAKIYMTKKTTRLRKDLVAVPLERSPFSSWPLLETLVDYISPASCANHFKHTQALQLITAVVQRTVGKKSEIYNEKFATLAPKIASKVQEVLEMSKNAGDKNVLNYAEMRTFIRFASTMIRFHKKAVKDDSKKINEVWKSEWFSSVTSMEMYDKQGMQVTCKQLFGLLEQ